MSETQTLGEPRVDQRDYHRPNHEANAINGEKPPTVSAEDAALESFDGLEDLIGDYKPASLDKIQKSLHMELQPFNAKEGHEHKNYINKEKNRLVKVDKVPVDDYQRQGREAVHKTLKEMWPDHFPNMYDSPKIEDENGGEPTTGIIVEPMSTHPQFAEALAAAQKGDPTLLDSINKHPFTEVTDECKKAALPFDFDSTVPDNFIITPDGRQILIDDALITPEEMLGAKDQINALMTKRGDHEDRHTRVSAYMAGMEALAKNKSNPEISENAPKIDKTTQRYGRSMNQTAPRS